MKGIKSINFSLLTETICGPNTINFLLLLLFIMNLLYLQCIEVDLILINFKIH